MSDTERVRAWRQRLKDGGLVPMTIWVKAETKARYEDLALQSHRSGSELVQLALDAYRCVFHGFLPPSPPECCHVIHGNVATQSRGFLPSIPRECCHPVSGMPVTLGASRRWIV